MTLRALILGAAIAVLSLSAGAEVIAVGTFTSGAVLLLHDTKGPCVGRAHHAEHRDAAGQITPGCWVRNGEQVAVAFLDGDVAVLPLSSFRPPAAT